MSTTSSIPQKQYRAFFFLVKYMMNIFQGYFIRILWRMNSLWSNYSTEIYVADHFGQNRKKNGEFVTTLLKIWIKKNSVPWNASEIQKHCYLQSILSRKLEIWAPERREGKFPKIYIRTPLAQSYLNYFLARICLLILCCLSQSQNLNIGEIVTFL